MKLKTNLDYVVLYARMLRENNKLFEQQKRLIEAQLKGSSSLFEGMFKGGDFKVGARRYLRGRGLLVSVK